MEDNHKTERRRPARPVMVKTDQDRTPANVKYFTDTFQIGRHSDCDLQIKDPAISRFHVKIRFDGEQWWVKDLESANGTYLDGARVQEAPLPDRAELELGQGGPRLWLVVEKAQEPELEQEDQVITDKKKAQPSVTQIVQHYFGKSSPDKAGEQTMMFRRAFERAQKKESKKYLTIIGAVVFLLLTASGVVIYQQIKLLNIRNSAEEIFYAMKSLELQIGQLEEFVLLKADTYQISELLAKREQIKEMADNYDKFVEQIGLYDKKMTSEERMILKISRTFGECELNVPKGFTSEVMKYIKKWQSSGRLKKALRRGKLKGYTQKIDEVMTKNNLPSHFFYPALQESNFQSRAVGPKTKYGFAKGIWQFIPMTAKHYGLKLGPLVEEPRYDAEDERFHMDKATEAAAKYLKYIYNTEAQASGLLVMASYNWGENNVRPMIRKMPENPRERNFWKLLAHHTIPKETYDYVFYIISAAVIGEDPALFGFDFPSPLPQEGSAHGDEVT